MNAAAGAMKKKINNGHLGTHGTGLARGWPRGGDSLAFQPAPGWPGVGTHTTGYVPRVAAHSESPGVPDPPLYSGFRDSYINQ